MELLSTINSLNLKTYRYHNKSMRRFFLFLPLHYLGMMIDELIFQGFIFSIIEVPVP
jgi:hypothetical protein